MEAVRSVAYDIGTGTSRSEDAIAFRADALVVRFREAGLRSALGKLLEETKSNEIAAIQPYNRAIWFALLGEYEFALNELQIAAESRPRPFNLIYVNIDRVFDPIRAAPKFQRILRTLGF